MVVEGFENQIMAHPVKEGLDVDLQYSAVFPAPPFAFLQGIVGRFVRAIAVGVIVKLRIEHSLHMDFHRSLSHAVCYGWYP